MAQFHTLKKTRRNAAGSLGRTGQAFYTLEALTSRAYAE